MNDTPLESIHRTDSSIPTKPTSRRIGTNLIVSVTAVLLGIAGFTVYRTGIIHLKPQVSEQSSLTPQSPDSESFADIKTSLLKADNVSFVALGASLGFIPAGRIQNLYGTHSQWLPFYSVMVPIDQVSKVAAAVRQHLSDRSGTADGQSGMDLESPVWIERQLTDNTSIAIKDGYYCLVPVDSRQYLCSVQGDCMPVDLSFGCVNILDYPNNTSDNVSAFIYDSLKQMGISCNETTCPVEETTNTVSIPQFSRSDVYFENLSPQRDSEYVQKVDKDIETSNMYFRNAGWNTTVTDTTQKEASWSGQNTRVIYSKEIEANNSTFGCTHGIAVWNRSRNFQKRQLIDCWVNIK